MTGADAGTGERTFGVAIRIPYPYHAQLADCRKRLGDPRAHTVPPHVTLLPPTPLRAGAFPAVEEHLAEVAATEAVFTLTLSGADTFRPVSPVAFVALTAGVGDCGRLERRVRSGPLARATEFPYYPHVTVAHDVPPAVLDQALEELAGYHARFPVGGFTLFEQGADSVWHPRRDFSFT